MSISLLSGMYRSALSRVSTVSLRASATATALGCMRTGFSTIMSANFVSAGASATLSNSTLHAGTPPLYVKFSTLALFSSSTSSSSASSASSSSASSSSVRPFRVLGVQQIALGGPSKSILHSLWVDTFGLEKVSTYRAESENVDEDVLKVGKGLLGTVEIDIMQPINPDKSPKVHIPPLNHIGLWIDDLSSCVKHLEGKGIRMAPGGIRKGASGHLVAFVHPKSTEGVLLELVQAPADVIAEYNKTR